MGEIYESITLSSFIIKKISCWINAKRVLIDKLLLIAWTKKTTIVYSTMQLSTLNNIDKIDDRVHITSSISFSLRFFFHLPILCLLSVALAVG